MKKYKIDVDKLSKKLFIVSLLSLAFIYGFLSYHYQVFPYSFIKDTRSSVNSLLINIGIKEQKFYKKTDYTKKLIIHEEKSINKGLTLVSSIIEDDTLSLKVIDTNGSVVHSWDVDWFKIWPDATHISEKRLPKSRPGTQIHGMVFLENGDVVFNYGGLGLVRLDVCGNVVWRLPYKTHHSIYRDEYDNLWVAGKKYHEEPLSGFPRYEPTFVEPTILKVSLEGKILSEISVLHLLKDNDLQSLLYMSVLNNEEARDSGDTLHLNDIETFPSHMEEGAFKYGDIMISLRNVNAVIVFSEADRKVKYVSVAGFVRQHDPDFIDGNTISIFDNIHIASASEKNIQKSRIIIKSFVDRQSYVYYEGNKKKPFFSGMLGKHQWLPNGNMLITEAAKGRAFEIDPQGKILWEYFNIVKKGYIGYLSEAQRLPAQYTKAFFDKKRQKCKIKN